MRRHDVAAVDRLAPATHRPPTGRKARVVFSRAAAMLHYKDTGLFHVDRGDGYAACSRNIELDPESGVAAGLISDERRCLRPPCFDGMMPYEEG